MKYVLVCIWFRLSPIEEYSHFFTSLITETFTVVPLKYCTLLEVKVHDTGGVELSLTFLKIVAFEKLVVAN